MNTNPTFRAILALTRRGWGGRSAFEYVCKLFDERDFEKIRRIAACERGAVAVEFAVCAAAIVMPCVAAGTILAGAALDFADRLNALVEEARRLCAELADCSTAAGEMTDE